MSAHLDADAGYLQGWPVNCVIARVESDNLTLSVRQVKIRPSFLPNVGDLAASLIERLLKQSHDLWKKFEAAMPGAEGEYILDMRTETFIPTDKYRR